MKMLRMMLVLAVLSPNSVLAGGTNVGGGNTGSEYLARWCNAALTTLKAYKKNALVSLQNHGDYALANSILVKGLIKSLDHDVQPDRDSLTRRALVRGLELASFIEVGRLDLTLNQRKSQHDFLRAYYEFVINDVAGHLDIRPFNPTVVLPAHTCNNCQADVEIFEKKTVEFAIKQLNTLARGILNPIQERGFTVFHPTLEPAHVLKIMELITHYTKEDLKGTLWSDYFQCITNELGRINEEVKDYNQGNSALYADDRFAVHMTAEEIMLVVNRLNKNFSCL